MENELLDIVDKNDNIICQDTKENKLKQSLISRNVAIFIINKDKKLLTPKRAPNKKTFPNRYDVAACGNVSAKESYEEAAKREIKEELGIECNITFLHKLYNEFNHEGITLKYMTSVFLGYYDGEVNLNEELVELKKLTVQEIEDMIKEDENLFTPGFIKDFNLVKNQLE